MTGRFIFLSALSFLVACSSGVKNAGGPVSSQEATPSSANNSEPERDLAIKRGICPAKLRVTVPSLADKHVPAPIAGVPVEAGFSFLEGPVWLNGALYMSYIVAVEDSPLDGGHVLKYSPTSGVEVFASNVGTNGLALSHDGLLLGASHQVGGIVKIATTLPAAPPQVLTREYDGNRFNSPNDLTLRADGTIYFTDPNYQCGGCKSQPSLGVYRLPSGGTPELLPTVRHDPPNGIALSPDGNTLYVGGSTLRAYPIAEDGTVGEGAPFGDLSGTDGLGIDCAGNVYVALFNENRVAVVRPNGEVLPGGLSIPHPTNVAFGGEDGMTLYVTNQEDNGAFRAIAWDVPGYPY